MFLLLFANVNNYIKLGKYENLLIKSIKIHMDREKVTVQKYPPLGNIWKHSDDFYSIDPHMQTWGLMFKKGRNNDDSLMDLTNFSE